MLAFCGVDGIKIRHLHASTNEFMRIYSHRNEMVSCMSFNPDGKLLAVVLERRTCVFDLESEETSPKHELQLFIRTVVFDNTGNRLLCRAGTEIFIFDLGMQAKSVSFPIDDDGMLYPPVAFSSDFKVIISSFTFHESFQACFRLKLWNAETGIELHALNGHSDRIRGIGVSPLGDIIASCSDDGTIVVYDCSTYAQVEVLNLCAAVADNEDSDIVTALTFAPSNRKFVCANPKKILVWEYERDASDLSSFIFTLLYSVDVHPGVLQLEWITSISVSADGSLFACTFDSSNTLKVFDMLSGQVQNECNIREQSVCSFSRELVILM